MDRSSAEPSVEELPGDRAEEWIRYHQSTAAPSTFVYEFVWDVTADAIGPFVTDVDGNVFLDFTSHVAAAPLGYNNPRVRERLEAFDLPDPAKFAGQDFYAAGGWPPENPGFPGPSQLMDRLVDVTDRYGMDTVFLSNSGAEAVENAIKICYDHRDGRYGVCFEGAFHGRTLGALSLNRSKGLYRRQFPEISGIHDVPFCDDSRCTPGTCSCGFFPGDEDESGSALRRILDPERGHVDPDEVSYVILEPIQGEGGYRIPSDPFADEVADLCETHDIPLIADEIQSGMGRTGKMWASDHYSISPNVIAVGKALRVGATVSTAEIFPDEEGRLSSTWGGGDLIASLQGVLTLDVIQEQDLLTNAIRRGRQLRDLVEDGDTDPVVDVRNRGLMFAVEFDTKEHREAAMRGALERGLLTLACGYKSLRLLPPLDVTEREIRVGADLLLSAIEDATSGVFVDTDETTDAS
jgi:4-aminobutyrate aminotransferase